MWTMTDNPVSRCFEVRSADPGQFKFNVYYTSRPKADAEASARAWAEAAGAEKVHTSMTGQYDPDWFVEGRF
jgi:hypothetical protein